MEKEDKKVQPCIYCEKGDKLDNVMLKIVELPYSIVYLYKNQQNRGRCIVAFKQHKTEYFQLSVEENAGFFADVSLTAKVLYDLYRPGKINYATFGDLAPHVHVHVVPKYEGTEQWGKPFQEKPKKFLGDSEYRELIDEIKNRFSELTENHNLK